MSDAQSIFSPTSTQERFGSLEHLIDTPVEADEFKGLGHERTAETLVETVLRAAKGIRSIGLEGGWGSGKSSVIEIARRKLNGQAGTINSHIFTFDMWTHQGDPIRRAFLQEFVSWLRQENLISKIDEEDWSEKIQARITQTTTHSEPVFSILGIIIIFIAPLLPLIYTWLSPFGFSKAIDIENILGFPVSISSIQILAAALFAFPYGWIACRWIFYSEPLGSAILTFSKNSEIDKKKQVIRDQDPTSVEFGQFLSKIISKAASSQHRILLVMDNIDRLPPDRLADAWAMMRSLVGNNGGLIGAKSEDKIWLLVPYDRGQIKDSFRSNDGDMQVVKDYGVIEKTFDLVLRVAPPIITHWRDYFYKQLDYAFRGDLKDDERHALLRCLEYNFLDNNRRVTPRAIKTYINDVVSLVMQWKTKIPIACVGFYVLHRVDLDHNDQQLRSGTLASVKYLALFGHLEWQKFVTSLHFNVSPDDAYEVLIGQDVERALERGDQERLKELSSNPGFDLVLGDLAGEKAENWAIADANAFAKMCYTLASIGNTAPSIDQVWRSFGAATQFLGELSQINNEAQNGLCCLIHCLPNAEVEKVATFLRTRLSDSAKAYDDFDGGRAWIHMFEALVSEIKSRFSSSSVFDSIMVPGGADFALGVLTELPKAQTVKMAQLQFRVERDDLTDTVVGALADPELDDWITPAFQCFRLSPALLDMKKINSELQTLLSSPPKSGKPAANRTRMRCLLSLKPESTRGVIDHLAKTHATLAYIEHAHAKMHDPVLTGLWLWAQARASGADQPSNPGQHAQYGDISNASNTYIFLQEAKDIDNKLVETYADCAARDQQFNHVVDMAIELNKKTSLYSIVLISMIERNLIHSLHVERTLSGFDKLSQIVGVDLTEKFVTIFGNWSIYIKEEMVEFLSRKFIRAVFEYKVKKLYIVFEYINNWLTKGTKEDDWVEAFKSESKRLELLFSVIETKGIKLPAALFRGALQKYTVSVMIEGDLPKKYINEWEKIIDAMHPQTARAFYQDLMYWFSRNSCESENVKTLLTLYPNVFGSIDPTKNADTMVSKILVSLVGENSDESLSLIEDNLSTFCQAYAAASQASKELLTETLDGAAASGSDESIAKLSPIAKTIGVELTPPNQQVSDTAPETDQSE